MSTQAAILMVDDDPDQCQNLSEILTDRGYRVDTAAEGQSALRLVERQAYDLALLDLRMPGMDGLALCREVIRLRPATVALLMTGYPEDVLPAVARAAGVHHVLPKPVNIPRLLMRIEESVAGNQEQNQSGPRTPFPTTGKPMREMNQDPLKIAEDCTRLDWRLGQSRRPGRDEPAAEGTDSR
jgi:DNA-binding response OmpR family regulator